MVPRLRRGDGDGRIAQADGRGLGSTRHGGTHARGVLGRGGGACEVLRAATGPDRRSGGAEVPAAPDRTEEARLEQLQRGGAGAEVLLPNHAQALGGAVRHSAGAYAAEAAADPLARGDRGVAAEDG